MKYSKITTSVVLGTTLGVGAVALAGTAGASTGAHSRLDRLHAIAISGTPPANFSCTNADRALTRIATAQDVLATREARIGTSLQRATAAGDSAKVASLTQRLDKETLANQDLTTVAHLITSSCPGSAADAATASSAAVRISATHQEAARIQRAAKRGALPTSFSCTSAAADQAQISSFVSTIDAKIAKLQSRAQSSSNSSRTARIEAKITKATTLKADAAKVSSMITADCGS